MNVSLRFQLNPSLYIKDPQDSALGKKLLKNSILLLDRIGFEAFTFKKLANEIGSAEKSIYRYFDNKHMLLLFLTSWYWEWVHYLIGLNTRNIEDPERKLKTVLRNIVHATSEFTANEYINEHILHKVIINEGSKSYHTYMVDEENNEGLFQSYKSVVSTVAGIILELNPKFTYPFSLSSNLFEMANNQIYFAQHIPKMTDLKDTKGKEEDLIKMLEYFTFKLIK